MVVNKRKKRQLLPGAAGPRGRCVVASALHYIICIGLLVIASIDFISSVLLVMMICVVLLVPSLMKHVVVQELFQQPCSRHHIFIFHITI